MSERYYLAIDFGTTNWKVAVFSGIGQLKAIKRCPSITHPDGLGHSWYDPDEIWTSIKQLIKAVVAESAVDISAISVASVGEASVPVDRDGEPLAELISWYDGRAIDEATEISQRIGADRVRMITGLDVSPVFSLPKMLWLYKRNDGLHDSVYKWMMIGDYICFRLSGEMVTDYTLASRSLAFDVGNQGWSEEMISSFGLSPDIFPEVLEAGSYIGNIIPSVAADLGLDADVKIVLGGHDHPCGTIVTKAALGACIHDSSGTAEALLAISRKGEPIVQRQLGQRTCRYLEKDRFYIVGGIVSSGISLDWAFKMLAPQIAGTTKEMLKERDAYLERIRESKACEKGVFFYPYLRGAGAPDWDAGLRGSFLGLSDDSDAASMIRAVIEGLCFQTRLILEMEETILNRPIEKICVTGGSSRNRVWQQIKADVLERPVGICGESEATALGAAMLAAIGDGYYASVEEASAALPDEAEVFYPSGASQRYADGFAVYKEGYGYLKDLNRVLMGRLS